MAHVSKSPQALFVATGGLRRVREGPVQALSHCWEDRTDLVRVVADGDDEIQGFSEVAIQRLGLLGGEIHPYLGHDRDRLSPGAEHLETVSSHVPQEPL